MVLVELAGIEFVFWFIVVGIPEIRDINMVDMYHCVKKCVFYNIINNLVCWLVIVYNVRVSHIVLWCLVSGLLVVYLEFLSLF
jgi:hypothetical protein